jgi:hypothetical protein
MLKNKDNDYRKEISQAIALSHQRLLSVVERGLNETNESINYIDIDSFPTNVWINLGDYIKVKKRNNRFGNLLNLDVHMKSGAKFSEHFHDDAIESTEVIYGEMLDVTTNTIYEKGAVVDYSFSVKHKPVALKETLLHVLYKKNKL